MLHSKPDLIDPHFLFYASAIGITPEICDIMRDIGAFYLNFGFDSGNDHALRILKGEKHSVTNNIKAAELATRKKMDIHVSFVLFGMGSKNETIQSCEESLKFATWLAESTNATTIECALLYPDRAAPIGNLIWNPGSYERLRKVYDLSFLDMEIILQLNEKYRNLIYINPDEIISDFCKACGTDVKLLLEYQTKIKDCCQKANIRFGYSQYGKDYDIN
jgi:hypothetical protein